MAAKLIRLTIDTREPPHTAWTFDPSVFVCERATLPEADYSLSDFPGVAAIERKELGDFVQCCVGSWRRFRDELERLETYKFACVAVEATTEDVMSHTYVGQAHPHSVLGRALAISLDYGIPVYWWGQRHVARWMAERWLRLAFDTVVRERGRGARSRAGRRVMMQVSPRGNM